MRYCTLCHWLLRAGWMAQELLSTFGTDLAGGVKLIPDTGGIFQIHCNGELIWDRKRDGGFPDVKLLKQRVRDLIDPDRDLGHVDRHSRKSPPTPASEQGAPPSQNSHHGSV
ncbi:MAG: SelT/SelW/SelH family protein [Lautropia sp.]|nr:SelT/SelW/SelH family protein [Lautropia sp.]